MYGLLLAYVMVVSGLIVGQLDHVPAMPLTASRSESNSSLPSQSPDAMPPPTLPLFDCVDGDCPNSYVCIAGSCVRSDHCKFDSDCDRPFKCVKSVCLDVKIKIIGPRTLDIPF